MLDLSKVHQGGLKAIREKLLFKAGIYDLFEVATADQQTAVDEAIKAMSPREFLDAVLRWHGIIGYTQQIIDIYEAAKAAELKSGHSDTTTGKE